MKREKTKPGEKKKEKERRWHGHQKAEEEAKRTIQETTGWRQLEHRICKEGGREGGNVIVSVSVWVVKAATTLPGR